jgi:hypothetical protein
MEDDMSTRAIYTFYDSDTEVHVYKHHDGYPYNGGVHNGTAYEAGGLVWINDAKAFAWDLPRFEADEFAASFVAANKSDGGGVRLIGDQKPWEYASDCDYWYKVACIDGDLHVTVLSVDWFGEVRDHRFANDVVGMEGPLDELLATQRARKGVA